jgi:hypothetical protein
VPRGENRQARQGPASPPPPLLVGPLPGTGKAVFAMVMLILIAVVCLARVGAFGLYYTIRDEGWGLVPDELWAPVHWLLGLLGSAYGALFLAAGIAWLIWVHQAHKNLPGLGAQGLYFSPGWAVGSYFIPIIALFWPYQAAQEAYRASDPDAWVEDGYAWRDVRGSYLIGFWWFFWLVGMVVLAQVAAQMDTSMDNPDALTAVVVQMVANAVAVPGAVLAVLVITTIQGRQRERLRRIQEGPDAADRE